MDESHETRLRHCWECRRRCLVCDFTQPSCQRCSSSGTACPGYGDEKPSRLRWLAPGRVASRQKRGTKARPGDTETRRDELSTTTVAEIPPESPNTGPPRTALRSDMCALLEAVAYFNTFIYPDLVPIRKLGPTPTIYSITPFHVRSGTAYPDHLRLSLICTTLSHRMVRTEDSTHSKPLTESFYRFRGLAIRSLRDDIDAEHRRMGDGVLAGIITLLLTDVQHGYSSAWRYHSEAVHRLITMRGGMQMVARSKTLEAALLCFIFLTVIGNTTSPASNLTMAQWHLDELDFILEEYGAGRFPFPMCPPPLLAEMIRINHLRMRATQPEPFANDGLTQEAYEVLGRIDSFSTVDWASCKPCSNTLWLSVGNSFKAAVTIFCIASLQSLSILPRNQALRERCVTQGLLLRASLMEALSAPGIGMFMLWPLVMLGIEATHGSLTMRAFVGTRLQEMSRHVGSYAPLTAKSVLRRFWASGDTNWDTCFQFQCVFVTQIAVDLSRLPPP